MGKIRVKTLGDESQEEKQKKKQEARLAESRQAKKTAKAPGLKGGERVTSVGPNIEDLEKLVPQTAPQAEEEKKKKEKFVKKKKQSKKYKTNIQIVKKDQVYTLKKAVEILKNLKKARFDETVELHINVKEKGISGKVSLPHETGKEVRIVIADPSKNTEEFEKILAEIEKGHINFNILVATPSAMPRLAKVAKVLGPRGLMPNPKAGTISDKPEELAKKLSSGQTNFKTEAQAPIIHMSVGKLSFPEKNLEENIIAVLSAISSTKITTVTLKSTMSPAIKLQITG